MCFGVFPVEVSLCYLVYGIRLMSFKKNKDDPFSHQLPAHIMSPMGVVGAQSIPLISCVDYMYRRELHRKTAFMGMLLPFISRRIGMDKAELSQHREARTLLWDYSRLCPPWSKGAAREGIVNPRVTVPSHVCFWVRAALWQGQNTILQDTIQLL